MNSQFRRIAITTALLLPAMTAVAHSQQPGDDPGPAGTNPLQPRLSPYLDLLRRDNSVLSPYHSFVRPRQEFRQGFRRQAAKIRRLERAVARPAATTSAQNRLRTGRGGTFHNYLHYYQFDTGGRR